MLCFRFSQAITAAIKPVVLARAVKSAGPQTSRSFSSLTPLRPSLSPSTLGFAPRSPATTTSLAVFPTTGTATATASGSIETLDLLPKISAHPALSGIQVRCGPRNTFSPSHFVRKRRHGFLSRIRTRKGRALLQRRRSKNRSTLSH